MVTFGQRFSFIQFNTNSGLPQSQVSSIVQDEKGYLWIGTYGGLAKFNGAQFSTFGKNNGLLNNRITKLQIINGVLFVGHPQGISIKQKGNSFTSITYADETILENVTGFAFIDSTLYVATNGSGLFQYEESKNKLIAVKSSPQRIRKLLQYKNTIYLATKEGVYNFDKVTFNLSASTKDISFSGITANKDYILATSYNGDLYEFYPKNDELKHLVNHSYMRFRDVLIDHKQQKWVNSRNGILHIKEQDTLSFNEKSGLPINDINVVFEDTENNIWIGTNGKGLIRFTDEVFTFYNEKSGFPSDLIIAMEIDKQNNKWFSTIDQGIFKMAPNGDIEKIEAINSAVWKITYHDDKVFFASNYGLFVYDYKTFKSYFTGNSKLPSNKIRGLHSFNDSTLIISTVEGSVFYTGKNNLITQPPPHIKDLKNVRDFESKGEVLYGAAPNGIFRLEENELSVEHMESGINCIEIDRNGQLWIGTENGLFLKKEKEIDKISLNQDSDLEYINFIQKFDTLMLIGTNNGLYEVGINHLQEYRYGITSGLIDLETNLNSNYIENNRFLWFGTASGLMRMDLNNRQSLKKNALPKIQLSSIIVNNQNVDQAIINLINQKDSSHVLKIKYADKNISFKFDGIYMTNPSALKYSYFLSGFSNNWSIPTKNPTISFTNLPPNDYELIFKVNNGLDKTSKTINIPIKVLPPYYQTWWFYTAVALLIFGIILIIERYRLKRIESRNYQVKLEFQNKLSKLEQQSLNASMNRHFIFNSLNSIQYYINSSDSKSANKYLSNFAKLIRKNLDSSYHEDGMVTLADEIERLNLYLNLEQMRFADRFKFEIEIDNSIETELLKVPAMFLQPFVENSIIHGVLPLKNKEGLIKITITDHLDHIRIEIKDNGVGIKTSKEKKNKNDEEHRSQGMLIAKGRIELLQKISERSIEMIGPTQIKEGDRLINGTVVVFKIMKQYLG
ncbi:hypothetical protein CW751_12955 [Brumimicrobium salinarum]|uniref:Signal transduction histidine kinase internal region domain-containing protein n=2 Tax=Brumimicrobium salinarum TaxID=2058658 RepID=A0A2I0QZV9_9FLAO|nr:hypothetical protein CW751_12955 [Brumimicrobium salinarum]